MSEQTTPMTNDKPEQEESVKPLIMVNVARGSMEATIRLVKVGDHVDPLTLEDLQRALAEHNVVQGIDQPSLLELVRFPMYDQEFTVARGKDAGVGENGSLDYLVSTVRVLKPSINDDGVADYKDLGYIQNVEKGERLCEVHPPTKGEDGWDVCGRTVEGRYGREVRAPVGPGAELDEDNHVIVAAVDGHVEVSHGIVSVHEILRIQGNVDNSTGNVSFPGDVFISGDVASGFTVKSGGSIVVKGHVEGAMLQAASDITVAEGVNGMNRGSLVSGGIVKCKFLQNCTVKCEEDIYADTIIYCVVECGGNVELSGKRSALVGGRATISGALLLKTIGTDSHVATEVNMQAAGRANSQEIMQLTANIAQLDTDITKLVQLLTRFDELAKAGRLDAEHAKTVHTVKQNYLALNSSRKQAVAQLERAKEEQLRASANNCFIKATGRVHRGVRINFGPLGMMVNESFTYSRISAIDGEIRVSPL